MIRHFLQPAWDAFCDAASIQGVRGFPTSAELLADRRRFAPVEWQTPEWEWVDPTSEQSAAKDAIGSFMSDYQTELGSRGRSWRAVFYQRAKEDRLRQRLGLLSPEEKQQEISAAQTIGMKQPASQPAQTETERQEPQAGTGEMSGLSTLQFNRNRKAITKTLDDLATGSISEAAARVFLSSIGMSPDNVEALIADAKDGTVDTPLEEAK
jgi:hypothetical protein